jgi:Pyruvate/2-oxoacid:ferredoxin oxidoreductase gamma subunit
VEREVLLTGIGGQGIQLVAQTLARAAISEGREVMLFGTYGGSMRGGNSDSTLVLGDQPILTPPTVTTASFALAMHPAYWPSVAKRLPPGTLAIINLGVFRAVPEAEGRQLVAIDASTIATDMGTPQAASMIALGALAAATQLVHIDSLVEGATQSLPPYRKRHAAENAAALRAGMALIPEPLMNAWNPNREPVVA